MIEASALASGSSGNCFYVSNGENSVLVDAGISCKQIEERLAKIGKSPEEIDALFLTHEHGDHIRGVDVFARRYKTPIYGTEGTLMKKVCSNSDLLRSIKNEDSVSIGNIKVEAFSKSHDASDPVIYSLFNDERVSIITDIGYCCDNVKKLVSESRILFLESNHDLDMLENGKYPIFLKRRISSEVGHLSNKKSALCVLENANSKLKNVILSHLSENNNKPEIAEKSFNILKERKDLNPEILISGRDNPTKLVKT